MLVIYKWTRFARPDKHMPLNKNYKRKARVVGRAKHNSCFSFVLYLFFSWLVKRNNGSLFLFADCVVKTILCQGLKTFASQNFLTCSLTNYCFGFCKEKSLICEDFLIYVINLIKVI